MKNKFKLIMVLFSCITILINSMPQIALAAESKEKKVDRAIQKLIESGWDKNEAIDTFPEEDLLRISDAVEVSSTTNYYMVKEGLKDKNKFEFIPMSKKDCLNAVEHKKNDSIESYASDTDTTSDGYFTSTITLTTYTTGLYLVSYSFKWLTDPFNRNIDAFAAISDSLTLQNVIIKYYKYDNIFGTIINPHEITPLVHTSTHGAAMEIDLANEPPLGYGINTNHRGYVSFSAIKSNSTYTVSAAWGEYYHNTSVITLSPGVGISGVSVSFAISSIMNELLPNPYVTLKLQ